MTEDLKATLKAHLIAQAKRHQFNWSKRHHHWDDWVTGTALADYRIQLGQVVFEGDVVLVKPGERRVDSKVTIYAPRLRAHVGVPADLIWIEEADDVRNA